MPLLTINHLRVHFPIAEGVSRAVDGVSLTIEPGEALALVGESGSGKSLTALAVMGLLPPAARIMGGAMTFAGRDLLSMSETERRTLRASSMAMVFQDPMSYLNPVISCGEQVGEALRVHGHFSRSETRLKVFDLFRETGLPDPERQAKQYPHELSGGMRQRVLIAMALAMGPQLLLADEPTTALDATVQSQILQLLRKLAKERNMALLLITHDLSAVAQIADRVAVMYSGTIVETLSIENLFQHPKHPYTKALIDSMPARVPLHEPLRGIPGQVPNPLHPPAGCRFHPRCTRILERCKREQPPFIHTVACFNPHL